MEQISLIHIFGGVVDYMVIEIPPARYNVAVQCDNSLPQS